MARANRPVSCFDCKKPITENMVSMIRVIVGDHLVGCYFAHAYKCQAASDTGKNDANTNSHIDPINPPHYQGDYVMRIIEDFTLDFLDGQVIKYILRSGRKIGTPAIDDYRKALWYLQRKISNIEKRVNSNASAGSSTPPPTSSKPDNS